MICPDLVSLESHFNPYKVNIGTVDRIPDIYVKVLVSVASFHRLMSYGPDPTPSSALVQRDADVFALRVEALRGLNEKLSLPDEQTSDATLLCVLSLMVASVGQLTTVVLPFSILTLVHLDPGFGLYGMAGASRGREEDHPDEGRSETDHLREPLLQTGLDLFHVVSLTPGLYYHHGR